MTSRERSLELWDNCQALQRAKIAEGMTPNDAHSYAAERWNAWALNLRAERERLKAEGRWAARVVRKNPTFFHVEGENDETSDWFDHARIDFNGVWFSRAELDESVIKTNEPTLLAEVLSSSGKGIDMRGFIFPGPTSFSLATFDGWVWFKGAHFDGPTSFDGTMFNGWAEFSAAEFRQNLRMKDAVFTDQGVFIEANFYKDVWFDLAEFSTADFSRAKFHGDASFVAVNCSRAFLATGAEFRVVPDFEQAAFNKPPNMDLDSIVEAADAKQKKISREGRYRTLKRLAAEAQNHGSELNFFAMEMKHRSADCLFGALRGLYLFFSDYGRSIIRPIIALSLNAVLFYIIYKIFQYIAFSSSASSCNVKHPAWTLALLNNFPLLSSPVPPSDRGAALKCISWAGDFLLPVAAMIGQNLLATLFFFFLLLGLRSRFRIR